MIVQGNVFASSTTFPVSGTTNPGLRMEPRVGSALINQGEIQIGAISSPSLVVGRGVASVFIAPAGLQVNGSKIYFGKTVTYPIITAEDLTSNGAATDLSVSAPSSYFYASTTSNGGSLVLSSGQVYTTEFRGYTRPDGYYYQPYVAVNGDFIASPIMLTEASLAVTQMYVEQINAPATSGTSVRVALYDDINKLGYPQNLRFELTSGGSVALGTTAGVKSLGTTIFGYLVPGLYWIVLKMDSMGTTASQFRSITGPNPYMPNWSASGGLQTNIAWKVNSPGAGVLPNFFPSGGVLMNACPIVGLVINVN